MFKVSAVPPRRSAVVTVFRGATATNEGTTAEPRRSWRCHCVLCLTNTAMAPRLRCDEGRRSAVSTIFRGATAINDGTTAEPRRTWRCHCRLCRTSTAVAPRLRCDGGITLTAYMDSWLNALLPGRRTVPYALRAGNGLPFPSVKTNRYKKNHLYRGVYQTARTA